MEQTVSRLVTRFLLCRGHRLPARWTAVDAQEFLQALADAVGNPVVTEANPLTVDRYEAGLERLADQGALQLGNMAMDGPLLEAFCCYLTERGLLTANPHIVNHVPLAAGTGLTQATPPSLSSPTAAPDTPVASVSDAGQAAGSPEQTPHLNPVLEQPLTLTSDWETWEELQTAFFEERETGRHRLEGHSPANYRSDLKLALGYFRDHHPSLTGDAVRKFVTWLEKTAVNPRNGKGYLRTTIVRKKNTVRTFLKFAAGKPQMAHLKGVDLDELLGSKKRDKVAVNPHRALAPEEDRAYYSAACSLPLAARVMALLPRSCALRAEDAGTLPWNAIDFANARLDYVPGKDGIRVKVPLDTEMLELLRCCRRRYLSQAAGRQCRPAIDGHVGGDGIKGSAPLAGALVYLVRPGGTEVSGATYQRYKS